MNEIIKTSADIVKAALWYRKNGKIQYIDGGLNTYDKAARLLTDRQGMAKFIATQIGPYPGRVLEIAAGTGLISQVLNDEFPQVHFIDLSFEAIQKLQARVGQNANSAQADFFQIPYEKKYFNTLVCVGGYRYVAKDSKDAFWKEASRVLQPEGRFFIAQFYPRGTSLVGSDIEEDLLIINNHFELSEQKTYITRLHNLPVRSGKYLSFEFHLNRSNE